MRETRISLPELAMIGGTRAALGAGLALLLADRLPDAQRRAVGWTLLAIGVLSTIPLALEVLGREPGLDAGTATSSEPADRLGEREAPVLGRAGAVPQEVS
jgi:hypothetical protein